MRLSPIRTLIRAAWICAVFFTMDSLRPQEASAQECARYCYGSYCWGENNAGYACMSSTFWGCITFPTSACSGVRG